jgi:mannose-1-phosphate guanylyltransferase
VGGDAAGNTARGDGRHLLIDTSDTYVYTSEGRLAVVVGLEGHVVVDTPDALLICPKEEAEHVRDVVERLGTEGLREFL